MSKYDLRDGKRGPVIAVPPGKTRITIRLDDDVLEWFREQADAAGGASYQTLINQALREYIVDRTEPLEEKIRQMVREEVARYGETLEPIGEELPLTEEQRQLIDRRLEEHRRDPD
jgi:predicted ribosome quality control (RQC) complex YloA/Tae2 family protein